MRWVSATLYYYLLCYHNCKERNIKTEAMFSMFSMFSYESESGYNLWVEENNFLRHKKSENCLKQKLVSLRKTTNSCINNNRLVCFVCVWLLTNLIFSWPLIQSWAHPRAEHILELGFTTFIRIGVVYANICSFATFIPA